MDPSFFIRNRERISHHGIIVMAAHTAMQRTHDVAAQFEQDSHFWYLTGIEEPDWLLVIADGKNLLIAPEIDEIHRVFDGALSSAQAMQISGVETVLSAQEGKVLLDELSAQHSTVYTLGKHPYSAHFNFMENPAQARLRRRLKKLFKTIEDIRPELLRLRAIKQPKEIELIRRSVERTCAGFIAARAELDSVMYEYEIEARFTHEFRSRGYTHGYEPIVASGGNACTLHYVKNNEAVSDGELVLIDIGAKYRGYSADITRTYAKGQPSPRQVEVHAAVEAAHQEIISLLRPGYEIRAYLKEVDRIMKAALKRVGLQYNDKHYREYFPHAISHGLGVDVHDSLGGYEIFEPGMVLTVEPGIYITKEQIGVRIEDDILITETGHENLSCGLSTALR